MYDFKTLDILSLSKPDTSMGRLYVANDVEKPTPQMSNGNNLNTVLTSSTSSSEKGPPYFSLPKSSREG